MNMATIVDDCKVEAEEYLSDPEPSAEVLTDLRELDFERGKAIMAAQITKSGGGSASQCFCSMASGC